MAFGFSTPITATMVLATVVATGVGTVAPVQAAEPTFRAQNNMKVGERANGLIEVGGFTSNAGLEDYWCAVGEYLHRVKGANWNRKVYVASRFVPAEVVRSRDAVLFTLDPQSAGITPLEKGFKVVGTLTIGRSKSVNTAFYSCDRFPTFFSH